MPAASNARPDTARPGPAGNVGADDPGRTHLVQRARCAVGEVRYEQVAGGVERQPAGDCGGERTDDAGRRHLDDADGIRGRVAAPAGSVQVAGRVEGQGRRLVEARDEGTDDAGRRNLKHRVGVLVGDVQVARRVERQRLGKGDPVSGVEERADHPGRRHLGHPVGGRVADVQVAGGVEREGHGGEQPSGEGGLNPGRRDPDDGAVGLGRGVFIAGVQVAGRVESDAYGVSDTAGEGANGRRAGRRAGEGDGDAERARRGVDRLARRS